MQAHSQSNPAAGNPPPHSSTPHSSAPHPSLRTSPQTSADRSGRPQPQLRATLTSSRVPAASASIAGHAGLAHDAGNLLGALELYCNLLSLPGVLGPEHRHYASELSLISERSSELIRRLLALSASSSTEHADSCGDELPSTPARHPHDEQPPARDPLTAHTLHRLRPVLESIAAGAASVTVVCPSSLPQLDLPAEIVERIAINLVRNAAQAIRTYQTNQAARTNPSQSTGEQPDSPEAAPSDPDRRGEIRIALAVAARRLRLTVEDNGPGMPPDAVAEFLRPSPLPPGAEHGLGHRIVHELATGSGGRISIRVRPGRGTLLCVAWPISNSCPSLLSTPSRKIAQRGFSTC